MALDIGAAKKRIVGQIRNAPKVASPADLESYLGSPVPVLGLSVPTMRAIVAAFAKAHKRLTATELNALGAALLYDDEFWVQRAVGTWLRECWKQDRRRTEAFLRNHVRGLPKVVITVATERVAKSFRDRLRRTHANRGPRRRPRS